MEVDIDPQNLRTGYTTGACATAACVAACTALYSGSWQDSVTIRLPRGREATFRIESAGQGNGWAEAAIRKDAGDDPDVTHGALIVVRVSESGERGQVDFAAGPGVGIVTRSGLPIAVGEPAINPVPRRMMSEAVEELWARYDRKSGILITISVPGGERIARKTWNPRLGIVNGISILGTTGIVRPFSCSAWIASIHRGIDVARSNGCDHVIGSTGSTSELTAGRIYDLPEFAMLDMGDFVGGMLKYLRSHPVAMVTIAGGFGKLTKMAQGAIDLHSKRSQIDFDRLATLAGSVNPELDDRRIEQIRNANTSTLALSIAGHHLADRVAIEAAATARKIIPGRSCEIEILVIDRSGRLVGAATSDKFLSRRTLG